MTEHAILTPAPPTPGVARSAARALLPGIAARAEDARIARDLPAETIAEIRAAGLWGMFRPRRWGGLEADPALFYAVQAILAEACPSTGWVYGVLSVQDFVVALFNAQAQADVWGDGEGALISSCFQPLGRATPVEGGYRLSGRWTFSSGSSHASWALLGAVLPDQPPPEPGRVPDRQLMLVPRADFRLVDTWHTIGLRGTGSNDIAIEDAFVPAHRLLSLGGGLQPLIGAVPDAGALYAFPWLYLFTSCVANFAIGAARGAQEAFLDVARSRVAAITGKIAREDPQVLMAAARMQAAVTRAEAMFATHAARFRDDIAAGRMTPMADALLMRFDMTSLVRDLASLADAMLLLLGGRGIFESPFTAIWLDLMAARGHVGNDPGVAGAALGNLMIRAG